MIDGVTIEEIIESFETVPYSGESSLHHRRRGYAATGWHPGEVERLFDVVYVSLPGGDTRNLLGSIEQQVPDLGRVHIGAAAGRRRCAEYTQSPVRDRP